MSPVIRKVPLDPLEYTMWAFKYLVLILALTPLFLCGQSDYASLLGRVDSLSSEYSHQEFLEALHVRDQKEQDELEILVMLIQRYEDETVGEFPDPDPIEAIKFKMEQMDLSQKDLAEVIGLKSRASEILSRKRPMSINIIRKISKALAIPADILIQPYETI